MPVFLGACDHALPRLGGRLRFERALESVRLVVAVRLVVDAHRDLVGVALHARGERDVVAGRDRRTDGPCAARPRASPSSSTTTEELLARGLGGSRLRLLERRVLLVEGRQRRVAAVELRLEVGRRGGGLGRLRLDLLLQVVDLLGLRCTADGVCTSRRRGAFRYASEENTHPQNLFLGMRRYWIIWPPRPVARQYAISIVRLSREPCAICKTALNLCAKSVH